MSDQKFDRFPSDFLKDVFIEVHLFDNPERDEHTTFVDHEMKHDLFHRAYDRISRIEIAFMKKDEEWFKLDKITPCTAEDEDTWLQSKYRDRHTRYEDVDQLACEKWTINMSDKRKVEYKLRFYQSKLDRFFFVLYPPTMRKLFYDYMFVAL